MNNLTKLILTLIDAAKVLGLSEVDLNNIKELFDHQEYGLAFDTIVTQLYEYEIGIDQRFYDLLEDIANSMCLSEDKYEFMKELIYDK